MAMRTRQSGRGQWSTTGRAGFGALVACSLLMTDAEAASASKAPLKAAAREPQFTVLNPEAPLPEIDTKALSPRLPALAGRTILIFDNRGGYERPMRGLADQLAPLLPPDTRVVYYTPTTATWTPADQAKVPAADAVIVGHAY
jgi:hypothetical protein